MAGILYVVATPIGNLEDVTLRALRVLREVAVIAAEDTRRTSRLLQHYSISTPTTSLHEHNERSRTPALLARLQAGESVALVSDAGTPLVSDPGAHLVAAAHAAGVRVEPVPGPSAALAALSAAGFETGGFVFAGFPPARPRARQTWLQALAGDSRTLVLYEAPHRIRDTLSDMLDIFGDRPIMVAREVTKRHEELVVRPISAHLAAISTGRGEYTLVIPPGQRQADHPGKSLDAAMALSKFRHLTEVKDVGRRQAIKSIAAEHGLGSGEVYRLVEAGKRSGR